MSSSEWDEVKRLAADFQRAQLAKSVQRLSERNCVELICKLLEASLLKLHHTSDGHTYITPDQLHREIQDELHFAGGRLNFVELSANLNIDLNIIEQEVQNLLKGGGSLQVVQSQLISNDYKLSLVQEISEKLLRNGTVSVEDLSQEYQLPGDFIKKLIDTRLVRSKTATPDTSDPSVYYTQQYISRQLARAMGLMTAVTVPTQLWKLVQAHSYNEKLFYSNVERLVKSGRLAGELSGLRQSKGYTFTPALYSSTQNALTDSFLKQNGYLEYSFVQHMGIEDPVGYVRGRYSNDTGVMMLEEVCVGSGLMQQLQAAIEEAIVSHTFVDTQMIMPSCFSSETCSRLLDHTLGQYQEKRYTKGRKKETVGAGGTGAIVLCDSYVISEVLLEDIKKHLESEMQSRGQKLVAAGGYKPKSAAGGASSKQHGDDGAAESRKDERRRKAAGGRTGGGTQGRETKTKSTKGGKKGGRGGKHAHDSDDDDHTEAASSSAAATTSGGLRFPEVEFLPVSELQGEVSRLPTMADADELMAEAMAHLLHDWSKKVYQAICERCYQSLVVSGGSCKKKSFQQLQDKLLGLLLTARLGQKATQEFGEDLCHQLSRHLLKTQGAELLTELVLYLTEDPTAGDLNAKDVAVEARLSLINQLPEDVPCRDQLLAAHRACSGSDVETFLDSIEEALPLAGILLPKKKDAKKERQVVSSHRQQLLEQLEGCCDSALCLHLASLLLFTSVTGHCLYASGKFVPNLLQYLKQHMPSDLHDMLTQYQGLVMQKLTTVADSDALGPVNGQLEELTPLLKERAITFKKAAVVA